MISRSIGLFALAIFAAALHGDAPPLKRSDTTIDRIRADIKYLASAELQGRGIGTRGEELAIDYIAKEFKKAGLKPAGEKGTFFQAVPLVMVTTGPKATLALVKGNETTTFKIEDEFAGFSKSQQSEDFDEIGRAHV